MERWAGAVGAVGAAGAAAVAVAGLEPKKPKPLDLAGALSGVDGLTFTAVLAGVGAGAVAWRLEDEEPKEPKPPLGLDGAGAAADWAGAEGLELDEELEPKEPKPLDLLELEDEDE